jgi:hypothetical protein
MPFEKGKSGNPGGKPKEKLFRAALIMELKAAGEDMPDLREIAKNLIARAKNTDAACNALMDRWGRSDQHAREGTCSCHYRPWKS